MRKLRRIRRVLAPVALGLYLSACHHGVALSGPRPQAAMPAHAQDTVARQPGSRIRITVPSRGLEKWVGSLRAVQGDTLVADDSPSDAWTIASPQVLRIPLDSVTRLEVSRGRHRQTARGAGVGVLVGAAAGLIVGPISMECPEYGCDTSPAVAAAVGGIVFGGVGALVGLGVGAATTSETWQEVPRAMLPAELAVGR